MDDIKRAARNVENEVRERLRDVDGHDVGDDVGNAGDDLRREAGNAGDDLRREAGNAGDDLRRDPGDPRWATDERRYHEAGDDELEDEGARTGALGHH